MEIPRIRCKTQVLHPIGYVNFQSCLPINFQYNPIRFQYSWLSDEQPIRIVELIFDEPDYINRSKSKRLWEACKRLWEFPIQKKIIPILICPLVSYIYTQYTTYCFITAIMKAIVEGPGEIDQHRTRHCWICSTNKLKLLEVLGVKMTHQSQKSLGCWVKASCAK